MDLAVIKTGGKQYLIKAGDKVKIEKLKEKSEGDKVEFSQVLLTAKKDGTQVKVGQPTVEGIKVKAKILQEGKSKKVVGYHYKPKTRNRKKFGHRQPYMEIEVEKI